MNSVNILGKEYKIQYEKDLKREGEHLDGHIDTTKAIIAIDRSLKGQHLKIVLLHEIFHGLLDRIGAGATLGEKFEECIVETLSTWVGENCKITFK